MLHLGLVLMLIAVIASAASLDETEVLYIKFRSGVLTDPSPPIRGDCWELEEFIHADSEILERLEEAGVAELCPVGLSWRNNDGVVRDIHGDRVSVVDFSSIYRVALSPHEDSGEIVDALNRIEGVEYAEVAGEGVLFNDRYSGLQWWMENDGDTSHNCSGTLDCEEDIDMNVPEGWVYADSSDALVGILDTGVYSGGYCSPTNTELNGSYNSDISRDFAGSGCMDDTENDYHGTHVSGIVAGEGDGAEGNDFQGVVGFTSPSGWHPLVMFRVGTTSPEDEYVIDALDFVANEDSAAFGKVQVLTCSWGKEDPGATLSAAMSNVYAQDMAIFAASGNTVDGGNWPYPAAYIDFTSSVAHILCDGTRREYWTGNYIDVTAPGGRHIQTTTDAGLDNCFGGTSASSPMAAGVASMLREFESHLTNDDVYALTGLTAYDVGSSGYDTSFGNGLIRADAALAAIDDGIASPSMPGSKVWTASISSSSSIEAVDSLDMAWQNPALDEGLGRTSYAKVYKVTGSATVSPGSGNHVAYAWPRHKSCGTVRGPDDLYYLDSTELPTVLPYFNTVRLGHWAVVDSVASNVITVSGYAYHLYEDDTEQDEIGWYPFNPWSNPPNPLFKVAYLVHSTGFAKGGFESEYVRPTPFSAGSTIEFTLSQPGPIRLSLYDVSGRLVKDFGMRQMQAGPNVWEIAPDMELLNLSSGVYFARAEGQGFAKTSKTVFVK